MSVIERIAKPGDADLDIDVDAVTITAVVRDGAHFIVEGRGGFGTWISTDGSRYISEPGDGDTDNGVKSLSMSFGIPDCTDEAIELYYERLTRWRDEATPLRFCGAPGRMFTVIEDRETWLALPRSGYRKPAEPSAS